MEAVRWLVLAAIAASTGGCKQLLGFGDPTREPSDAGAAGDSRDGALPSCTLHSDCASDACSPDGTCADETDVAYVAPTGAGTGCTMVMPCATVANALATARAYVKVTGTITETVTIGRAVTVLADPGARLTSGGGGNGGKPTLQIGASVAVAIYDLEITGSTKAAIETSGNPTVTLQRVAIDGNTGSGIQASGGTIDVFRSTIVDNAGGGLLLSGVKFDVENDFIVENGSSTAQFGGVTITGGAVGTLAFDTISDNVAQAGAVAGVQCSAASQPSTYADDLIYNNGGAQISSNAGACAFSYSDIGPDGTTGTGVVDVDPRFASTTDYHLMSASPCVDAADPAATLAIDFDGQMRPYGPASDIGADEVAP